MRPVPFIRSSTAITEGFFVIAAVIAVTLVASTVIPGIALLSNSYAAQAAQDKNKVDVQLTVIFAYANTGSSTVDVWVKNTGIAAISTSAVNESTIFFGPTGNFKMIPHGGGDPPSWTATIEGQNGTTDEFTPGETLLVTINNGSPVASGGYFFQITTYVGTSFDYTFSV